MIPADTIVQWIRHPISDVMNPHLAPVDTVTGHAPAAGKASNIADARFVLTNDLANVHLRAATAG